MRKIYLILICLFFLLTDCSKQNEKISDLTQLHDKRICVLTGSAGDVVAKKLFPNAKFYDMISATDAALSVKTGKADAFIHNFNILANILDKEPELMIFDKPVSEIEIAIAIKKGNDKLLNNINDVLNKLSNEGTIDIMKQKWIDKRYNEIPSLPEFIVDAEDVLVMGTCAKAEPLSFVYNNAFTGFDIELAMRIGRELNKKIEIRDMNFESLIPALQSGKIDFAVSNFNVTEERKKFVDFSHSYLKNDISVLVRK